MSLTDLASIGATGGMTGRSMPPSWLTPRPDVAERHGGLALRLNT
jgi:hypothetical protein